MMKKSGLLILSLWILLTGCAKDDRHWQETKFPDLKLYNVYWINNQFLVSGIDVVNQLVILNSADGINWQRNNTGIIHSYLSLNWINNQFIVGYCDNNCGTQGYLVSSNATNWTPITLSIMITNDTTEIVYDGQKYITAGGYGKIMVSTDLVSWSEHLLSDNLLVIHHILFSNGKYFAIGDISKNQEYTYSIFTSTDGLDWKEIELFRGVPVNDMKYLNGEYIFVGPFGVIYTSPDGKKWINHSILFGPDFKTVARGPNDYLITATQKTTEIWTTSDCPDPCTGFILTSP